MMSRPAPGPGIVARTLDILTVPSGVWATNGCSSAVSPMIESCCVMYSARQLGSLGTRRAGPDRDDLTEVLEGAGPVECRGAAGLRGV